MNNEESIGTTPSGGVKSIIYYQDDNNQPSEKYHATKAQIIEIDEQGNILKTIYATINRTNN